MQCLPVVVLLQVIRHRLSTTEITCIPAAAGYGPTAGPPDRRDRPRRRRTLLCAPAAGTYSPRRRFTVSDAAEVDRSYDLGHLT